MKKANLIETARMLYIDKLYTFEEVARELDVSERTVRRWGQEGGWAEKIQTIHAARERMSEQVREVTALLGEGLIGQLEEGKEPNSRVLDAYARLATSLLKVREYDKDAEAEGVDKSADNEAAMKNAVSQFEDLFKKEFPK